MAWTYGRQEERVLLRLLPSIPDVSLAASSSSFLKVDDNRRRRGGTLSPTKSIASEYNGWKDDDDDEYVVVVVDGGAGDGSGEGGNGGGGCGHPTVSYSRRIEREKGKDRSEEGNGGEDEHCARVSPRGHEPTDTRRPHVVTVTEKNMHASETLAAAAQKRQGQLVRDRSQY